MNTEHSKPHIEVLLRRLYGNERFYPANEEAKTLCTLMGVKTFTREQLKICRQADWKVVVKQEEYDLDDLRTRHN